MSEPAVDIGNSSGHHPLKGSDQFPHFSLQRVDATAMPRVWRDIAVLLSVLQNHRAAAIVEQLLKILALDTAMSELRVPRAISFRSHRVLVRLLNADQNLSTTWKSSIASSTFARSREAEWHSVPEDKERPARMARA